MAARAAVRVSLRGALDKQVYRDPANRNDGMIPISERRIAMRDGACFGVEADCGWRGRWY